MQLVEIIYFHDGMHFNCLHSLQVGCVVLEATYHNVRYAVQEGCNAQGKYHSLKLKMESQ